jgi:hypothetical protein
MISKDDEMPFSGLVEVTDWVGNVKRQFLHRNDSVFDVARPDTNATWTENCVSVPVYGWITTSYVGGPGHLYPSSQRWGIIDYQTVCSFTQVVTYEGCFDCGTYVPGGGGGGGSGDGDNRQPTIEIDDEELLACPIGYFPNSIGECFKLPCIGDPMPDLELSEWNRGKGSNRFGCVRLDPNATCGGELGKQVHRGIDLKANIGDPVFSVSNGKVFAVSQGGNFGNYIIIQSGSVFYLYAHLNSLPEVNGTIMAGELIGEAGDSDTNGDRTYI